MHVANRTDWEHILVFPILPKSEEPSSEENGSQTMVPKEDLIVLVRNDSGEWDFPRIDVYRTSFRGQSKAAALIAMKQSLRVNQDPHRIYYERTIGNADVYLCPVNDQELLAEGHPFTEGREYVIVAERSAADTLQISNDARRILLHCRGERDRERKATQAA